MSTDWMFASKPSNRSSKRRPRWTMEELGFDALGPDSYDD